MYSASECLTFLSMAWIRHMIAAGMYLDLSFNHYARRDKHHTRLCRVGASLCRAAALPIGLLYPAHLVVTSSCPQFYPHNLFRFPGTFEPSSDCSPPLLCYRNSMIRWWSSKGGKMCEPSLAL